MDQYKIYKVEGKSGTKNYSYPKVALSKETAIEAVIKQVTFKLSDITTSEIQADEEIKMFENQITEVLEEIKELSHASAKQKVKLSDFRVFKGEVVSKTAKGIEHNLFKVAFSMGQVKRIKYYTGKTRDEIRDAVGNLYGKVNFEYVQVVDIDSEIEKALEQSKRIEYNLAAKNNKVIRNVAKISKLKEARELCIVSNKRHDFIKKHRQAE